MLSAGSRCVLLGFFLLCAEESLGHVHGDSLSFASDKDSYDSARTRNYATVDETTILLPTTIFVTHYVDVPVTQYVNVTYEVNKTETRTTVEDVTESETTTLSYTDLETMSITKTDLETVTSIETDSETITKTEVDSETITKTAVLTSSYDPCPTICSMYEFAHSGMYWWSH